MFYTDTDSFFLQFFVDDLVKEINLHLQLRDAFVFSEIEHTHYSQLCGPIANVHGCEVGYFKDETKGDPIVEFVGLRPKMYSFTVCSATQYTEWVNYKIEIRNKHVAKGISRSQIKRFKHEDYISMYNSGAHKIVVNRPIGSKLHQVFHLILSHINHNLGTMLVWFFACLHYGARKARTLPIQW